MYDIAGVQEAVKADLLNAMMTHNRVDEWSRKLTSELTSQCQRALS